MARSSSAVHSSRETLVRYRRRLHTTDPPGNTYPTHRLNLPGKTLSHRLILTPQAKTHTQAQIHRLIHTGTHLGSWKYSPQVTHLHTSADTVAREQWSSHQASASIPLAPHHAAWPRHMNDASRVPLCRGRGTGTTRL
ncbi:hypothetical protein DPMN_089430 [Dreissena polymorpha]|uniref:Uncharacterized protein n=1 Tax=Dreissena polymorpha TaxID=45954 RepID=A0A9D4KWD7_DREPO|nr:hypothetical protein DPMN_089430 [Dreissena polymorpha]